MKPFSPIELTLFLLLFTLSTSRDCYLSCDEVQITYDKNLCYTNCDMKYIVGITVGATSFLVILICILCLCRNRNFTCMYFEKRRLQKLHNVVDQGDYNEESFEEEKENMVKALKKSDLVNNFFFRKTDQVLPMKMTKDSLQMNKLEPFLYSIDFDGEDKFEKFHAQGNFLVKNGQPFLWFLKQYHNPESVIQYGLKGIVTFESGTVNAKSWQGNWHCKGEQQNDLLSGNWGLVMRVQGAHNQLQQIKTQTYII